MKTSHNKPHHLRRACAASFTVTVLLSPGVFAQPIPSHITVAQAEQRARTLFSIPKDYTVAQRTYSTATDLAPPTYSLTFANAAEGDQTHTISVQINAENGNVVSYAGESTAGAFRFPLPVSPDQAKTIAITWAKKLFPDQYPLVQMEQQIAANPGPLTQPVSYQFVFERTVSGIPAPFNGFALTLDQNGQLSQVYDQWTDADFPSTTGLIPMARATAVYEQSLGLALGYADVWTNKSVPQTRLVYQPGLVNWGPGWNTTFDTDLSSATPAIEAKSGKILSATGETLGIPASSHFLPVKSGGPTEFPGISKTNWTDQQAMDYVKSLLQIPSNMTLLNAYENSAGSTAGAASNDDFWSFTWVGNGHRIYASVNATRGLLTSYSGYIDKPAPHTEAHQANINAAAAAFLERLYPNDSGGLALVPSASTDSVRQSVHRTFSIIPLVHGIPVLTGIGQFTVDGTTALKVVSFTQQAFPNLTALPSPSHAVTPAQAATDWVKNNPLRLEYLIVQPTWLPTAPTTGSIPGHTRVVLVYAPETGPYASDLSMDALTQRFNGGNSTTLVPYTGPVRDLPNGQGSSQIQLLLARGLLAVDVSDGVHPNQPMTRGAFIKLMVDAFGVSQFRPLSPSERRVLRDVPATAVYRDEVAAAIERGWITTAAVYQPGTLITRGEAAQLIAQALGYHALLTHPGLFRLTATDAAAVPRADYAADAICVSLGILQLMDSRFNTNTKLSVKDAAVAVVQMANLYASDTLGLSTMSTAGFARTELTTH